MPCGSPPGGPAGAEPAAVTAPATVTGTTVEIRRTAPAIQPIAAHPFLVPCKPRACKPRARNSPTPPPLRPPPHRHCVIQLRVSRKSRRRGKSEGVTVSGDAGGYRGGLGGTHPDRAGELAAEVGATRNTQVIYSAGRFGRDGELR